MNKSTKSMKSTYICCMLKERREEYSFKFSVGFIEKFELLRNHICNFAKLNAEKVEKKHLIEHV